MRVKANKKIKSQTKHSNQLELRFRENIKNKKNINFKYNKSLNAIYKIFLSSFIIVSFFFVAPIFINYADTVFSSSLELDIRKINRIFNISSF